MLGVKMFSRKSDLVPGFSTILKCTPECDGIMALHTDGKALQEAYFSSTFSNLLNTRYSVPGPGKKTVLIPSTRYPVKNGTRYIPNKHRYTSYNHSIHRSSLSSSFKLESLPPTSPPARQQHSLRTYLTV